MIVFYYSRTGSCKELAEKIAAKKGCDAVRIEDGGKFKGILGFVKGGYYSLSDKTVDISLSKDVSFDEQEKILLITPLWAGFAAAPASAFLKKYREKIKEADIIISSGSGIEDKAFERLPQIVNKIGYKAAVKGKNYDAVLAEY